MSHKLTVRHTVFTCYFSNFFQAIGSVFPILLVSIRTLFGISYTQFGLLVTINFVTQVLSDLAFSKPIDKYGFRRFAIGGPILSGCGLLLFALAPVLFTGHVFVGFCIGMFLFAAGGGLQELLLSPILDALPLDESRKAQSMSLLHSFFAWGQIFVVIITTLLLAFAGAERWQLIIAGWAVVPFISAVLFAKVPLYARVPVGKEMPVRELFKNKIFLLALLAILFGGAAEVTMSQWASAFIERGLALPKLMGDTLGVCGFSLMLALGRTLYGTKGAANSINKLMTIGSLGAVVTYLVAALSPSPIVGMVACALTGICVSLLWPGAVIVAGKHLPLAGASMYALLSATGDMGASLASFATGKLADRFQAVSFLGSTGEQAGLRIALLFATVFAVASFAVNLVLKTQVKSVNEKTNITALPKEGQN